MNKFISIGIALILLGVAGVYFVNYDQFGGEKPKQEGKVKKEKKLDTPKVFVSTVKNSNIPITVKATGSLMAKNRVELFSEVQGIFQQSSKAFKPGVYYRKGELLLQIRGDENYANLQAQKSTLYNLISTSLPDLKIDYPEAFPKWEKYVADFDMEKSIQSLPETASTKEKVFISSKNIFNTYYNVKSLEIRQSKYIISAPFSGVLTASDITPGTLVRPGQRLGEFISTGTFELEVDVSASLSQYLKVGKKVKVLNINNNAEELTGTVIRINGKVDRASQTVTVYLQVQGSNLQEGMYLEAVIEAKAEENVFELPRNLLIDKEVLYVVKEGKLDLVRIVPVYFNDKTAIVRGLADGDQVLIKPLPGAYSGMAVELLEE